MFETTNHDLNGVAKTLLIPLYNRVMESQRPDAMLKDEKAVELVTQMRLDFSQVRQVRMTELLKVMRIMFTREFDRYARDFLSHHPLLACSVLEDAWLEWVTAISPTRRLRAL